MYDSRELFSRLDFGHPGLAAARAALREGDDQGALRAIIEHFRTRTQPSYLFDEADVAAFHDPQIVQEADRVCDHFLFGYDLGR